MTEQGSVYLAIAGGIARITFNRPAARNALTWPMYDGLARAIETIDATPGLRLAILRGAGGKAFVAGTDIAQFRDFATGRDGVEYEARIDACVTELERLSVPTLAVIEGLAIGGGLAIANACDLRIATCGARLGAPIAKTVGNCLSARNLQRLCRIIGLATVQRMLLTAEMPSAEDLAPLGYFAAVVAPDQLDETVEQLAQTILQLAPVTISTTRRILARLATDPRADCDDLIALCYASRDFGEGVDAFLTKRAPKWEGR